MSFHPDWDYEKAFAHLIRLRQEAELHTQVARELESLAKQARARARLKKTQAKNCNEMFNKPRVRHDPDVTTGFDG